MQKITVYPKSELECANIVPVVFSLYGTQDEVNNLSLVHDWQPFFDEIFTIAIEKGIWRNDIKKVVITNEYYKEIKQQAELWNLKTNVTREKEFRGISKLLSNPDKPESIIFFALEALHSLQDPEILRAILFLLIDTTIKDIVPYDYQKYNNPRTELRLFNDFIENLIISLSSHWHLKEHEINILGRPSFWVTPDEAFYAFARKLKKALFDYNSKYLDNQEDSLWECFCKLQKAFNNLFTLLVDAYLYEGDLILSNVKYKQICLTVLLDIEQLKLDMELSKTLSINKFKKTFKDFFATFEIEIVDNTNNSQFGLYFSRNPKKYFKGELIETENRIVCFLDILGFSEIIKEYDINEDSSALQKIQKAFKEAIFSLKSALKISQKQDASEFLEYKVFSDNICISIPYFENEPDFMSNFATITLYVRLLQNALASHGFLVRGGIACGSYYADDNFIFSGGLVKSYLLESKKAIYPRVLIDSDIIIRLSTYEKKSLYQYGLANVLVEDNKGDIFLNSLGFINNSIAQFETTVKSLKAELTTDYKPFDNIFNSFLSQIIDTSANLIKESINITDTDNFDNKVVLNLRNLINIYRVHENVRVREKYEWLERFLDWYMNDMKPNENFRLFAC